MTLGLRHTDGRLLHSHFVAALLNDLFGIQVRSGCFCAGPYIHRLYPIDHGWSSWMEQQSAAGNEGAKLSLVRLSFNYFTSEEVFEYVLEAVRFVADEGWKLLPLYRFEPESGLWKHRGDEPTSLRLADSPSRWGGWRFRPAVPSSTRARSGSPREGAAPRGHGRGGPAGDATRRSAVERGVRARALVSASSRGVARALRTERTARGSTSRAVSGPARPIPEGTSSDRLSHRSAQPRTPRP